MTCTTPSRRHGATAIVLALLMPCASPAQLPGKPLPVLAWNTMGLAKSGSGRSPTAVTFPAALTALNGKRVTVSGFMVPLEAKAEQTRFLLTVKPQDCEFCIEGGPATFIEVWSKPLRFSSKPFFLAGTLRLLHDDPSGMYYRLDGAGVAAVGSEIAH
jgi:hypothetical protein